MWKAGLVSLAVLANCAAPQEGFDRIGQGVNVQQRIVSTLGIDIPSAQERAESQGFDNARNVGFAASSIAADGLTGGLGGLAGILASPATAKELNSFLILEADPEMDVEQVAQNVEATIAPLIGISQGELIVSFTPQGTANGKEIYGASFYGNRNNPTNYRVFRQVTDQYPSLLSTYVPPLQVNGEWQRPYLYRRGSRLPL